LSKVQVMERDRDQHRRPWPAIMPGRTATGARPGVLRLVNRACGTQSGAEDADTRSCIKMVDRYWLGVMTALVGCGILLAGQSAVAQETDPAHLGSIEARAVWLVTRFDTDGDLMLSRRELPEDMTRLTREFDRLDLDADGRLSAQELVRIRELAPRTGAGSPPGQSAVTAVDGPEPAASIASGSNDIVRVSPLGASYFGLAILSQDNKIAFQYRDQIWVGELDPEHGSFLSGAGRDYLMDSGVEPLGETIGGPEFGLDAQGWAVFYSKQHDGEAQIWRATMDSEAVRAQPLTSGQPHQTQLASKHAQVTATRLLGIRGTRRDGERVWFDEDDPSASQPVHMVEPGVMSARWIDGTLRLVFSQREGPADGQPAIFDTRTGVSRTLTQDDGDKTAPHGWIAPDHDDQILVLAVVDDRAVAVYKDKGRKYWERIATLTIPSASRNGLIGAAEPFVIGERSYVSLTINSDRAGIAEVADGEVWIIGVEEDPDERLERRCDSGQRPLTRFDPEVFIGEKEAFVYYNVVTEGRTFEVRRCRSGITIR